MGFDGEGDVGESGAGAVKCVGAGNGSILALLSDIVGLVEDPRFGTCASATATIIAFNLCLGVSEAQSTCMQSDWTTCNKTDRRHKSAPR